MLENLSLQKLSTIVLLVLLIIAGVFVAGTYHLDSKVNEINIAWLSFKSQHAEKARLETSLRATLGYGGMIHDFKNYILRKDFVRLSSLQQSLGAAQSIVEQYAALSTTQAERLVLEDISQMLESYHDGLELARSEIKKGKTSRQIDNLVRIDDSFALRGLEVLREEIVSEYEYYRDTSQKPVLANLIRAKLGYGGMIHAFKNYVLRGDEEYLVKAKISVKEAEVLISKYYALEHSRGENTALEDIEKTLELYKNKFDVVSKMTKKKLSPEEIDKVVRINDKYALRGLKTLDQDIVLQIEKKSEQLSQKLVDIKKDEEVDAYVIVFMIIMLACFLFVVFSRRIIKPVHELSVVMHEIALGNIDVDYYYSDKAQSELGDMARSLKIFKENERKRRIAEDEVRRLAMTDPLTGLANRNQLEKKYEAMTALARREERLIVLFALDLDKFKPVNDEHGHAAGDAVLKSVAKNLLLAFRETDLVARVGGDEFVVIFYGPESLDTITSVARRIIDLLSSPIPVETKLLNIGASIGIAIHQPGDTESMEMLMQRADKALYEAKETGRNKYCIDNGESAAKEVVMLHHKK